MAESNVEAEHEWSDWAQDTAEDTVVAMETLLATLRAFEDVLRQQEISVTSSTEYCDNFCQALMHYAGSRNSMDHGLPLLEVYCLSINCFASARSHLNAESDRVALVLKRLALSCFELLLSVPDNEIPYEAWLQFHHSVQNAHNTLIQYGSTDLQALLQITGEGGAWSNPVLSSLLTGQPTNTDEVNAYITLEGEGFMEMRVKHLEKMGEVAKSVVLAKACTECSSIPNQATFRQMYLSMLCLLLPNEEAILEISRQDCKDVLEITCSLESEGEENTAFILCTTFLTQQLQQQSLYCSWELISLWIKLQKRLDPSPISLLERCLQFAAIAKTDQHLLYLVRVIQKEVDGHGLHSSVELCVKALRLPKQKDSETRTSICKTMSCLLPNDLEVLRACHLTEFLLGPCQEAFTSLEELYLCPDQKYDQENVTIPNSLRCELLLALKAYWPFDPEFWDWKTLKYHCISLLGFKPKSVEEDEDEIEYKQENNIQFDLKDEIKSEFEPLNRINGCLSEDKCNDKNLTNIQTDIKGEHEIKKTKLRCQICKRSVTDMQVVHHSKRHATVNNHPCPVCLEKFKTRKDLVLHLQMHIQHQTHNPQENIKNEDTQKEMDNDDDDIEPGEIAIDPSLILYYKSTHDPDVLNHIVEQTKTMKEKPADDDEHITFEYIDKHFKLQNREEYPCPGTNCTRVFKHSKYLYVHLKAEHKGDDNVKFFHQMRDKREKCVFCRRHFVSAYHHRKHRKIHYGDLPYMCVVVGCGARFGTSNQLVVHKQTHGFQLNYQCELKGCYVTYSDLGQIYHHEAQHFRDAAFTCSGTKCKKYYLSKKEFLNHLSTHNITFKEADFDSQRKAKQKLFKTVCPGPVRSLRVTEPTESVNGDALSSPSSTTSKIVQEPDTNEPKATITLVAVCFDGSKFTCGFEKCGMTFSRARDVQRHLKCAHPEHLKLENKEQKHGKEENSMFRGKKELPIEEMEGNEVSQSLFMESGKDKKASSYLKTNELSYVEPETRNDALNEILIGINKLSLNNSTSSSLAVETPASTQCTSAISLHQEIIAKPPVVLLKKRTNLGKSQRPTGKALKEEVGVESVALAKPYTCEMKGCHFRSAQSYSLQRHYSSIHCLSVEEAKRLTSLKTTSFKPYACHLCDKRHRQKRVLKNHFIQSHSMDETLADKICCGYLKFKGNKKLKSRTKRQSQPLAYHSPNVDMKESSMLQEKHESNNTFEIAANGENTKSPSQSEEEGEDEPKVKESYSEQKEASEENATHQVRTRRLVAKGNLCYILDKFSKPFHCVAKNCDAAFSTQGGLVRHLQLVHHYNRSQLLLEKDVQQTPEGRKRSYPNLDEPQPQFKCHFTNCNASYHLKSSLVRHTRDVHAQPHELIRCEFDGCSRAFTHEKALKKHTLYSHFEYYDSLVVRLQSTHKRSYAGYQKKVLNAPQSSQKEDSFPPMNERPSQECKTGTESDEKTDSSPEGRKESRSRTKRKKLLLSDLILRSHEEALQMCQDRDLRVAYPCMVKDCDSVVTYLHSIHRHYVKVHHLNKDEMGKNEDKLVFTPEQLEVLIQRESAKPLVPEACLLQEVNETRKLETESEVSENQPSTTSPTLKETETQDEDNHEPLIAPEEKKEDPQPEGQSEVSNEGQKMSKDDLSAELHTETQDTFKQEERLSLDQIIPLIRPVTVDLSPPCSLRLTAEEAFQDLLKKDCGKVLNGSALLPSLVCQPLKTTNELSEQPSNLKEGQPESPSQYPFDIAAYKPIGFESSFLKFIRETAPTDEEEEEQGQGTESFGHSCSVKENSQLETSCTRSRRASPSGMGSNAETKDFTSVQNLKSILDKALAGCGDLAIKQLQYLRPVVVLGKPVCTTSLPELFPSKSNKLLFGS